MYVSLPFDLLALLFIGYPRLCFLLTICGRAMLWPFLFKLGNCSNNGVMLSLSPSSHDALLLLFKIADLTPLSCNHFHSWCPFSIAWSDLSARPPQLLTQSSRCPSKVRCHFGCRVDNPNSNHLLFPSAMAFSRNTKSAGVGKSPRSNPRTADQIASRHPMRFL